MGIEGQLRDVSLADICQLLSMGRKTGCLTVTDRSNFGYVYFKGGRVIYATVLNRPDRLGELLVRNNVINREELSAGMHSQASHPGKRLGQIVYGSGRREAPAGEDVSVTQRLNLGDAFYRAGMLEDAEREYGAVVEADPGQAEARSRLAIIALRAGEPEKALEHFDALLAKEDGGAIILRNRAVALEQLGRYAEALKSIDRALGLVPDDGRLVLARSIARFKNHQPEAALESFRKYRRSLGKDEAPLPMYFAYALLAAAAAGEMDEALHLGREGMTAYPGNGAILVNLGAVLERRGESDAAEALYLRAVGETPPLPQAHKNLGDLAYRRGDQAGARAHYERALQLNSRLGDDLYLKLGNLVYKDGDRDWALELWKKALELNPENEVVRTNLDLIAAAPGR